MTPAWAAPIWTLSFSLAAGLCGLSVSCLEVKASVGQDVLLSCVHRHPSSVPQNVSFFWRDQQFRILLLVMDSVPKPRPQHQVFRGRVDMFPGLFVKGNFSIVLQNVQESDSNNYTCIVPRLHFQHSTRLTASGVVPHRPGTRAFYLSLILISLLL